MSPQRAADPPDLLDQFLRLPEAVGDDEQRQKMNRYFRSRVGVDPDAARIRKAKLETIRKFPELIDYYIRLKEEDGDQAESVSAAHVRFAEEMLVASVEAVVADLKTKTNFFDQSWTSKEEAHERVQAFKHYVEHQDGYLLINSPSRGRAKEPEVQLFFGLIWCFSEFDVNREPNNGRGPVDFKVSFGAGDKSLIEFKMASNSQLKRNLQNQVEVYEQANRTTGAIKAIVFYTAEEEARAKGIVDALGLTDEPHVVLIDARDDNKPSASTA